MIDQQMLGIGRNAAGENVWHCRHCNQPADDAKGAADKNRQVYLLMCPAGKFTLGEWATPQEKQDELAAYRGALGG
jgi:hypothetical protein